MPIPVFKGNGIDEHCPEATGYELYAEVGVPEYGSE
jgi:hypothetical protein